VEESEAGGEEIGESVVAEGGVELVNFVEKRNYGFHRRHTKNF
jgi:hypothetical protein